MMFIDVLQRCSVIFIDPPEIAASGVPIGIQPGPCTLKVCGAGASAKFEAAVLQRRHKRGRAWTPALNHSRGKEARDGAHGTVNGENHRKHQKKTAKKHAKPIGRRMDLSFNRISLIVLPSFVLLWWSQ